MDEPTQDELFLDAVETIILDALARIGEQPKSQVRVLQAAPGGGAGGRQGTWSAIAVDDAIRAIRQHNDFDPPSGSPES